jgi:hypothetical protein
MRHTNPAAEDASEQARQEFFGTEKKTIKPNLPSAEFFKTRIFHPSFLPSQWSSTNHNLLGSKEPTFYGAAT